MDADDICLPDRLERQVTFLDSHPEVGAVGTNTQPVDAGGRPVRRPAGNLPTLPHHVRWRLILYNCLNHPTVMLRRGVLRAVGGYDPATFPADDCDLWLAWQSVTQLANLPAVLLEDRQHAGSVTSTASRREKATKELEVLSEAHARVRRWRQPPGSGTGCSLDRARDDPRRDHHRRRRDDQSERIDP